MKPNPQQHANAAADDAGGGQQGSLEAMFAGRKPRGGLLALGSEAGSLIRGYASEDPAVREAAYRRWAELDAMLPKAEPPVSEREAGLSQANRERLRVGLSKIVETLQDIEQSVSAQASPTDRGASPEP